MNRLRYLLLVVIGLWLCTAAWADPPGRVGRLAEMQGTVWFYSPDNGEWIAAARNHPVTTGDRIATDDGARAELSVGSSSLRLDGGSEVEVRRLDDEAVRLQLLSGSVALRVRSPAEVSDFEVVTDEGRFVPLSVGSFRIDRADETSTATAWRGSLRYEGDGQALILDNGQRADFWLDGQTARYNLVAPDRDAFADWVATRDREDDAVVRAPYVSPEMTGADDLGRYGSWQQSPDYGALWVPTVVVPGWAPYRYGHWAFVQPWGWTWIDDAPWGFAPFHYGRWVEFGGRWCWSPGRFVARPVYAPALVAWVGGPRLSVSVQVGSRPSVGWFPLGPREVYVPGYRVSPRYVRNVNITQVTNITNVANIVNSPNAVVNQTTYVNRRSAVTIVPNSVLANRQPVAPVALKVVDQHPVREWSRRPVLAAAPVVPTPVAQLERRAPALPLGETTTRLRGPRERAPLAQANREPPAVAGGNAAAVPNPPRMPAPQGLPKIRVPAPQGDVRAPGPRGEVHPPAAPGEIRAPHESRRGDRRAAPLPPRGVPTPPRADPRRERIDTPRIEAPAPPRAGSNAREGRGRPEPMPRPMPRPHTIPAPAPVAAPRAAMPTPPQVVRPAMPEQRVQPRAAHRGSAEPAEGPRERGEARPHGRGNGINRNLPQ